MLAMAFVWIDIVLKIILWFIWDVMLLSVSESCNDGIKNGDETKVDCGGSECRPCGTK